MLPEPMMLMVVMMYLLSVGRNWSVRATMGVATDRASEIKHAIADSEPKFVVACLGGKAARLRRRSLAPAVAVRPARPCVRCRFSLALTRRRPPVVAQGTLNHEGPTTGTFLSHGFDHVHSGRSKKRSTDPRWRRHLKASTTLRSSTRSRARSFHCAPSTSMSSRGKGRPGSRAPPSHRRGVRAAPRSCRRRGERSVSLLADRLMDRADRARTFTHGGCDPLHRAMTHIAGGEESWDAGLERQRLTAE
jgi:hypothetical protein